MHADAWVGFQPLLDLRVLVVRVVVHHQVQLDTGVDPGYLAQEEEQLLVAVVAVGGGLPGPSAGDSEQGGGAVAHVVGAAVLDQVGLHRKYWRAAVQCLDLGLLVHAQHHGVAGRVEVEAHDVDHLGLQVRAGGEAKALAAPGPDPVLTPDPGDRGVTDTKLRILTQGPRGPLRQPRRPGGRTQCHGSNSRSVDLLSTTRTSTVSKPVQPVAHIALMPGQHSLARNPDPLSDMRVGHSLPGQQHDPRPPHKSGTHPRAAPSAQAPQHPHHEASSTRMSRI